MNNQEKAYLVKELKEIRKEIDSCRGRKTAQERLAKLINKISLSKNDTIWS